MTCAAKRGKSGTELATVQSSVTLLRGWRSKWIQELDFGGGHRSLPTNKASKSSELLFDFDFVSRQLQTVLEEQHILLNRIPRVQDVQSAWLILLHCASARAHHYIRALHPAATLSAAPPRTRIPAFWASWADSLAMIRQRHPDVAVQLVHQLEGRHIS